MLNISNKTPFETSLTLVTGRDGQDLCVVYFSASCELRNGRWSVCDEQMMAPMVDEPWDPDTPSSIKLPSQLAFDKPATDVIVLGDVVSPQNQPTEMMDVGVEVADRSVWLRVFGERVWHRGRVSKPKPFQRVALSWENAFGGSEKVGGQDLSYEHNALGKGWRPDQFKQTEDYQGVLLPNIEWPQHLLQSPFERPRPAGFGVVPVENPARAALAGTHDQDWQQTRAPFAPDDFNPQFFNAAIPELQFSGFLRGDETVRLTGFSTLGPISFQLPAMRPKGLAEALGAQHSLDFRLQTVLLDTTSGTNDSASQNESLNLRMYWQAAVPVCRTIAEVKDLKVYLQS